MKNNNWEKKFDEIEKEWEKHRTMNTCSVCDSPKGHTTIRKFISNLLAQEKEKNYKDIPMGVSQWRNHGKKWHYWEFWAEEERKRLLEEVEKWANENKFPLEVCAKIETLLKALKDK